MDKNVSKSINKNLSSKYSQELLDQYAIDPLKISSEKRFKKQQKKLMS